MKGSIAAAWSATRAANMVQRVWAVLLAVALCLWLVPTAVLADDGGDSDTFSVALTIVDTTDAENGVLYNGAIGGMTSENTVADLLAAAGFTEAASADETENDDSLYYSSWGSPTFRGNNTVEQPDGSWTYWVTMFNGDSANYASAYLTSTLQENGHYQYIYTSDTTFAYDDPDAGFPVQLTIVDTSDAENGVLYNGAIGGMTSENTVADLLAAAGFTEAASADETENDDSLYYSSWGSPTFRGNNTVEQPDGSWTYWVTMFNGDSANYASAYLTSTLQENGRYQYIYTSDTMFEYSDAVLQLAIYTVYDPLTDTADPGSGTDSGTESGTDANDSSGQGTVVDEAVFNSLFENIANSYEGASEEWKALALAAIGRTSSVDVDTLVANAQAALSDYGTTDLQRYILALTAVGETDLAAELVEAMATSSTATSTINGQIFALLAYDSGPYDVPQDALMTEDELVAAILDAQLESGGWAWSGDEPDADMTAMALTALALRVSESTEVEEAVNKGIEALQALQYEDGGFRASGEDASSPVNANTTAYVVIAMCALGIDPATSWVTENGSAPLSALLSQASSDNTAFLYNGELNDMATYQGFLALVAYQGLKNTASAYNVYTQAKLGQAGLNAAETTDGTAACEDASSSTSGSAIKTGDTATPFAAGIAVIALCVLAASMAATRRMRKGREIPPRE